MHKRFSLKNIELFNCGYTVLDGPADYLEISSHVLSASQCLLSFSVKPLQMMFDLLKSRFPIK